MHSESFTLLRELDVIGQHRPESESLVVSFGERQDSNLQSKLERLCHCYISGDDAERKFIRQQAATQCEFRIQIFRYLNYVVEQINGESDANMLKLGLAAISIENCQCDYRDTLTILARLFLRAERAGIDPRAFFVTAAEWSTDSATTGGCQSLAHAMLNLESYAVLGRKPRHK